MKNCFLQDICREKVPVPIEYSSLSRYTEKHSPTNPDWGFLNLVILDYSEWGKIVLRENSLVDKASVDIFIHTARFQNTWVNALLKNYLLNQHTPLIPAAGKAETAGL